MFKEIKGWESTHFINEEGVVLVKERMVGGANGTKRKLKKHYLKWNYQKGYPTVALYADNKVKRYFVHRLVYLSHVGEIPKLMQINHKDGVKDNNHISNLEVVTPKENTAHAWRKGLSKKYLGERCSTSKLKDEDIIKIRHLSQIGVSQSKIAKQYQTHQTNIHYILSGKTWGHVT